jgi:hypothetical protein
MSKNSENNQAYRGLKFENSIKRRAQSELQNIFENFYGKQISCRNFCSNFFRQLLQSKMSKTWYFIKNSSRKKSLLLQEEDIKKIKIKTTGLPPVKRFLYSHIARLTYLILKISEAHEGTCTSACPSSLGNVPYTFCVGTETSYCLPSNQ